MTELLDELLATLAFAGVGLLLLVAGYLMVDLLTPGRLGRLVFVEHRRDPSVLLASSLLALGGIVATSIYQADGSQWRNLLETTAFGLVGVALLGLSYFLLDVLTPGRLRDLVGDESNDPAVWVTASLQLAVGLIVAASLT